MTNTVVYLLTCFSNYIIAAILTGLISELLTHSTIYAYGSFLYKAFKDVL